MPLNNQALSNKTTMYSLMQALKDTINYNLNCVKIATVVSFDASTMTAKCRVNNKRVRQIKQDGNQELEEYPDIYAKVHFFGWGDIGATYPITAGMEGILLFNDRELQTWFLTSNGGQLAYDRCHDLSDAIFICGLHSQPKIPLLPYLTTCLHLYFKGSDIQIADTSVTENTKEHTTNAEDKITENTKEFKINADDSIKENTKEYEIQADTSYKMTTITQTENAVTRNINATNNNITATTSHTGSLSATTLVDNTAATGIFTSADNKIITVTNGIVRKISSSGQ